MLSRRLFASWRVVGTAGHTHDQSRHRSSKSGDGYGEGLEPPSSLFDVVRQHEAVEAEQRAARQRKPTQARSTRTSGAMPNVVPGGRRPTLLRPEVHGAAAPPPEAAASAPRGLVQTVRYAAQVAAAGGRSPSDAVLLTPLTPAALRSRRRPRATRGEGALLTESQRAAPAPSRQRMPDAVARKEAERFGHGFDDESQSIVAKVSAAIVAFCAVCTMAAYSIRPGHYALRGDTSEALQTVSAGGQANAESESVVDGRAIGANALLAGPTTASFATPYWTPSTDAVHRMLLGRSVL
jgi:hypothetical protein